MSSKNKTEQERLDAAIGQLAGHLKDMRKDIDDLRKAGRKQKIPSQEVNRLIECLLIEFRRRLIEDMPNTEVMIGPIMRYLRE